MEDKEVHTFLKCIIRKANAIRKLEFEHAYYDIAILHVNHYATETFTGEINRKHYFRSTLLKARLAGTYSSLTEMNNQKLWLGGRNWFAAVNLIYAMALLFFVVIEWCRFTRKWVLENSTRTRVCFYQTPPSQTRWNTKSIFNFDMYEFRVSLLLNRSSYQGYRTQSAQQFTHRLRKNCWTYTL